MAKRGTVSNEDLAGQMALFEEKTERRLRALERQMKELSADEGDEEEPPPAGDARETLERMQALFADLPRSAWRGVPKDASKNFRRYLYQ